MFEFNSNPLTHATSNSMLTPVSPKLFLPDPPAFQTFSDANLRREADHYERVTVELGRINLQGR